MQPSVNVGIARRAGELAGRRWVVHCECETLVMPSAERHRIEVKQYLKRGRVAQDAGELDDTGQVPEERGVFHTQRCMVRDKPKLHIIKINRRE